MYEYDNKENIINDFLEFKKICNEKDTKKIIDLYVMSLYYDILDYLQEEPDDNGEHVTNYIIETIQEFLKSEV